jgi:hypothetical protein
MAIPVGKKQSPLFTQANRLFKQSWVVEIAWKLWGGE